MFSVVNVYLDHLKFCVVCIHGRMYVCCSECYVVPNDGYVVSNECNVVSNECDEPNPWFLQSIGTHGGKVMYFGCFA